MDRQDTDAVASETPYSECTAERRNASIRALKHSVHHYGIFLLALCLFLNVSDTGSKVDIVSGFSLRLAIIDLFAKLRLFYLDGTSLVTVKAPRPGAGTERPALSLRRIE